MKENKYDNPAFFEKYAHMARSEKGLSGAGEWQTLEPLLPDFTGKDVLDLGCGYGWHCIYAGEHGASSVTGVDISEKMLAVARKKTKCEQVRYQLSSIEEADFADETFDIVLSSLAFHYVRDFDAVCRNVWRMLKNNGVFIFSVEHPVFTAQGPQDWVRDEAGEILHFPVDHYFYEGRREANFLGEAVIKYHRTLTAYLDGLLANGFRIQRVVEPMPPENMLEVSGMADEMRRPMMLIVRAGKEK